MTHTIPEIGGRWDGSSLLWRGRGGRGGAWAQTSPLDGSVIQMVSLLDGEELEALVGWDGPAPTMSRDELRAFCRRLHGALCGLAPELEEAMLRETGFTRRDCREMVAGSLQLVEEFPAFILSTHTAPTPPIHYGTDAGRRRIRLAAAPWGTVAVILPQNAFLLVALTCLLNALWAGNRVILRAPQQSARSAALLALAVEVARPPDGSVSVVLTRAREFVDALCRSPRPGLVHYMGSSAHAPSVMTQAFQGRKGVLIDGQGNGWVYVAEDACLETAVRVLTEGAVRYNGQTCTSVNGAVIAPAVYPALRRRLEAAWGDLRAGNPLREEVAVGPLFDDAQAQFCLDLIRESGGTILVGGHRRGNLLSPTLVEAPAPDSDLVTEGVFGCALWIAPGTAEDFVSRWGHNRYPLCAGVLSASAGSFPWQARLSNLARLTVNGDPSIEDVFEPWGGYAASGANPVGHWVGKYQRVVQLDEAL